MGRGQQEGTSSWVERRKEHEKGEEEGQFTSRPDQQDHQEEQNDNEFGGIELLWAATVSVTKLAITQHSEQLKNN